MLCLRLALGAGNGPGLVECSTSSIFKGDSTGSIIWPMVPSARIMADHAVLVRQVEALDGELGHLLDAGRGQDDHVEVAVAAALGGLEVVRLSWAGCRPAPGRPAARSPPSAGTIRSRQIG